MILKRCEKEKNNNKKTVIYYCLSDVSKQKCVSQWSAHTCEIKQVVFSADFTTCYSLSNDGVVSGRGQRLFT